MSNFNIAFLKMRASRPESTFRPGIRQLVPALRQAFTGTLMLNSDYLLDDAEKVLRAGEADTTIRGRLHAQFPFQARASSMVFSLCSCRLYNQTLIARS